MSLASSPASTGRLSSASSGSMSTKFSASAAASASASWISAPSPRRSQTFSWRSSRCSAGARAKSCRTARASQQPCQLAVAQAAPQLLRAAPDAAPCELALSGLPQRGRVEAAELHLSAWVCEPTALPGGHGFQSQGGGQLAWNTKRLRNKTVRIQRQKTQDKAGRSKRKAKNETSLKHETPRNETIVVQKQAEMQNSARQSK